jgi:pimeloyl-ACP methyl ester carboxylesterase
VWGSRFVSESALTTRVKQARRAVGDDGTHQRVIKTVHGRGYRVVADVQVLDDPAPPADAEGQGEDVAAEVEPPAGDDALVGSVPETRYVDNDGASIAYQVFGSGPDLVLISGFATNVELQWEHPAPASLLRRLGGFARVTVLDKRGTGLSDRVGATDAPPLEQRADDVRAVMDAVGIERATVFGSSEGGALAVLLAATHPDRVERLVLHGTWARHPWAPGDPRRAAYTERVWGEGRAYGHLAPSVAATPAGRRFLARYERQGASPRTARRLVELMCEIDVTELLPAVTQPTLVLHREHDGVYDLDNAQDLVDHLPDARLVVLAGDDHAIFSGDLDPLVAAVESFVARTHGPTPGQAERFLATVLCVDIVGSTGEVQRVGDRAWAEVLDRFHAGAAEAVAAARGRVVGTSGDGLLATFDGPGRAVHAAGAVRAVAAPLGIEVPAGLHTAEIERRGEDVAGVGVHVASRVADLAPPGSIWVTRTVTDLVAGVGLEFEDRGEHVLRGLDRRWDLYEALV